MKESQLAEKTGIALAGRGCTSQEWGIGSLSIAACAVTEKSSMKTLVIHVPESDYTTINEAKSAADAAALLFRAGWTPIKVVGKNPAYGEGKGWQGKHFDSEDAVRKYFSDWTGSKTVPDEKGNPIVQYCNVGLLMGRRFMLGHNCRETLDAARAECPFYDETLARMGRNPYECAIFELTDDGKLHKNKLMREVKTEGSVVKRITLCDLWTGDSQFVAWGIHPDGKTRYIFTNTNPILPVTTGYVKELVARTATRLGVADPYAEKNATPKKVYPKDNIFARVKEKVRISDVLGTNETRIMCPIHKQVSSNPAAVVYDDRTIYCHSAGCYADVVSLFAYQNGLSQLESALALAQKYAVEMPPNPKNGLAEPSAASANAFLRKTNDEGKKNPQEPQGGGGASEQIPSASAAAYNADGSADGTVSDKKIEPYPSFPLGKITPEMVSPPKWIVNPYVPHNAITVLGGGTRNFKTTIGLYIAAHVAAGKSVWGLPTEQQTVLWIDEESGISFVYSILKSIVSGWLPEERIKVEEHLRITYMQGMRLDRANPRFRVLIEQVKPQIIFIDALRRVYGGEESASDVINNLFTYSFKPLLNDSKTIVLLHHNRKAATNGRPNPDEDEADMLRGSGDIPAMSASIVALTRMRGENKVLISQPKLRAGQEREPHLLEVIHGDVFKIEDLGVARKEQAKAILAARAIKEWLISKRKLEVKTGEVIDALVRKGYAKRTVEEGIKGLVDEGSLRKVLKGTYEFIPSKGVELDSAPLSDFDDVAPNEEVQK